MDSVCEECGKELSMSDQLKAKQFEGKVICKECFLKKKGIVNETVEKDGSQVERTSITHGRELLRNASQLSKALGGIVIFIGLYIGIFTGMVEPNMKGHSFGTGDQIEIAVGCALLML